MKRRILSFILALVTVLTFVPVNVLAEASLPAAITVEYAGNQVIPGTSTLIGKGGDTFQFVAKDQSGNPTPVIWKSSSSYAGSLDENGLFTAAASLSAGGTSMLYITATSTLNPSVKAEGRFSLTGYEFSAYQKNQTVALSEDGQTAKTVTFSGGSNGHNNWSFEIPADIGVLQGDVQKESAVKLALYRPGIISAGFSLDFDSSMSDTATVTVTGVAVEDLDGNRGKIYLNMEDGSLPFVELCAFCEEGKAVQSWSSADESVATVDENGLVTGISAGTAIISAVDSSGKKGGILVVVSEKSFPSFESLEFLTTSLTSGAWVKGKTYQPKKTEYDLPIRTYSVSSLALQNTTLYDTEKFTATAVYTDANGVVQSVPIKSGALTTLANQPFEDSELIITLQSKTEPAIKTVYTFHVNRPRDGSKNIKSSGIVIFPEDRELLPTKYKGQAEGTMFRADSAGNPTSGTGVTASQYYYRAYTLNQEKAFSLELSGSTAYTHLRYSTDNGQTWAELSQGAGKTGLIAFPQSSSDSAPCVKVMVQVLDDKSYSDHLKAGKDGFADCRPNTYTVWVEQVALSSASAQIITATSEYGDWYPTLRDDVYAYNIVVPNGTKTGILAYTVSAGAVVKLGSSVQTPDEKGVYTIALKTSNQTLSISTVDGQLTNSYTFKLQAKSKYDSPNKVVDYLCINSQYTNGGTGTSPEATLSGTMKSLGGFGGYITYYYENALTDNPNHKFGVDFYVYGNANKDGTTSTGMSFFEPGQVWVSEDGEKWYALAGSAHYDDGVDWNYTVNYKKTASGKTAWTDSHGNIHNGASYSGAWPKASAYLLNNSADEESITLSGILLPAASGADVAIGTSTDAYPVNWGYSDALINGTVGADANPYLDNTKHDQPASGFDLAWAVDADGMPVDVSDKAFHYIKVQTASNIWHPSFGEKSTEITQIVRTTAQENPVGKTPSPLGVTLTDGISSETVSFSEGQSVYTVSLGDMKYISLSLNGVLEGSNIYVNNQRIEADEAAGGIKVTKENGEKLVRILIQSGEAEPKIYLLKLTSNASAQGELIEKIKLNVSGAIRSAETKDGKIYTATTGYRMDRIGILPVADPAVRITVNGEPVKESYSLLEGENLFTVVGEKDGVSYTVTLKINRAAASAVAGKIKVYFSLFGDGKHDSSVCHTLAFGGLEAWIDRAEMTVNAPATVLDVFEAAMQDRYPYTNAGGNYIYEIGGLHELDNGARSGWMYTLNGRYPNLGIAEQALKDGDEIVFHYTDDYAKEHSVISDDNADIQRTILLIESIGKVGVHSKSAIAAARNAYDALTEAQKKLISDYEVLLAAETAYAKLCAEQSRLDKMDVVRELHKANQKYIKETAFQPSYGSIGGEWAVLGLARSGVEVPSAYYQDYLTSVLSYVGRTINEKEQLHRTKSTENSRLILALTSIGADPRSFGGHNLLAGLSDFEYVCKQGINGPIFALIALDSHDYEIPAAEGIRNVTTREKLISYLLDVQLSNGLWALSDTEEDPDITAMAIQALAPYYSTDQAAKKAIDQALCALSELQLPDGGFAGGGVENAESCAQVVTALSVLGIDADQDGRFIKNGNSALDALLAFTGESGGFQHVAGASPDLMASEQGLYALAAYVRMLDAQRSLYDMQEVRLCDAETVFTPQTGDSSEPVLWLGLMLSAAAMLAVLSVENKCKKIRG